MLKGLIAVILFLPAAAFAAIGGDPHSVYEIATENNVFIGVRAAGMGGAQIAAAEDGAALWYNPALLTRIRRIEVAGALSYQRFFNETTYDLRNPVVANQAQTNNTRLNSFWAIFPVPTDRGGLTLGFSGNRIKNFDRIFRYENQPGWWENPDETAEGFGGGENDNGGLWAYSFGGGIEISRNASVGLSLDILDGSDDYSQMFDSINGIAIYSDRFNLQDSYTGVTGKVGLAFSAGPYLHLGSVIKFPTEITIKQIYDEREDINGNVDYYYGTGRYKYVMPFAFGAGAAFYYHQLLLTGDVNYSDYTQLEYKSGLNRAAANEDVKRYYRDVLGVNLGAEYSFPNAGVTIRGGYSHDPIAFKYYSDNKDPNIYTGGLSYLIDKTLKLDLAVNFSKWTTSDPDFNDGIATREKYWAQRFYLGVSYRY
jgi:long-subunit fatty acid transport protein